MKGRDSAEWRRRRREFKALGLPCWLCGRDIDYELPFPDRWSFTLDHRVPMSKGGDPLDPGNLAPAHYICNNRKGNRLTPIKPKTIEFNTSRQW